MKRKFLSVLVAGVLCITLVPATAFAANTETIDANAPKTDSSTLTDNLAKPADFNLVEEDANNPDLSEEDAEQGTGNDKDPTTPEVPGEPDLPETPGAESGPPEAATNLAVEEVSYNSVSLSWEAAERATKYVVYRSDAKNGNYRKISTVTDGEAYLDENVKMGATYYYKILSFNVHTRGTFSNIVSARPIVGAPQDVVAIHTKADTVQVSWKQVEGATKYVIYRSTEKNGKYAKIATSPELDRFIDTGLDADKTYYYQVLPFCVHTRGLFSEPVAAKATLDKLTGLEAVSLENGTILVTWEETPGADQYNVYRSTSEEGEYKLVATLDQLITYEDKDVKLGTNYYYKVAPLCGGVEGEIVGPVTAVATHSEIVESILSVGRSYIGTPYVYGGKTPAGFDCSGYVWYVLNQAGYKISYRTSSQWRSTNYPTYYKLSDAKPGDILCFNGHVGIYAGNGMMLDSGRGGVRETSLSLPYWQNNFRMIKRVL